MRPVAPKGLHSIAQGDRDVTLGWVLEKHPADMDVGGVAHGSDHGLGSRVLRSLRQRPVGAEIWGACLPRVASCDPGPSA